jgi:superfamily II DNA or RNA helicase
MGDFYKPALQVAVDKPTITGEALSHYNKLAKGKRTLIFCVSIEHSKNVVRQFQIAGMLAAHVDGDTPYDERDRIMKKFERGEIRVLSNVDLFGEGLDISGIEALLVLRPTQSRSLHRQMIGRCLRTHPGKDYAIIMDAAGNMQRHGLPDEEIIWSLEGRTKQECKAATGPSIRICPKCYACSFRGQEACPYCGELYPIEPRTVEEIEGELEEIKIINRAKRKREEGMAKTMAELVAVGRSRGYRNPYYWAQMKLQGRGRR